jgi:hypothetical protein
MMSIRIMMALITALAVAGAATARADSVDGKPMHRADRLQPASERGSPAILFEGGGATRLWPLDSCATDDDSDRTRPCTVGGAF